MKVCACVWGGGGVGGWWGINVHVCTHVLFGLNF